MNFVSDPVLVISFCVIEDSLINHIFFELVDDFDLVKINKSAIWSAAWNIVDCVSLNGNFDFYELIDEGNPEMVPRIR